MSQSKRSLNEHAEDVERTDDGGGGGGRPTRERRPLKKRTSFRREKRRLIGRRRRNVEGVARARPWVTSAHKDNCRNCQLMTESKWQHRASGDPASTASAAVSIMRRRGTPRPWHVLVLYLSFFIYFCISFVRSFVRFMESGFHRWTIGAPKHWDSVLKVVAARGPFVSCALVSLVFVQLVFFYFLHRFHGVRSALSSASSTSGWRSVGSESMSLLWRPTDALTSSVQPIARFKQKIEVLSALRICWCLTW